MTDEQNARLNALRALAGEHFNDSDVHALGNLAQRLILEAGFEALMGEEDYAAALRAEAGMIAESMRYLSGEAVVHG